MITSYFSEEKLDALEWMMVDNEAKSMKVSKNSEVQSEYRKIASKINEYLLDIGIEDKPQRYEAIGRLFFLIPKTSIFKKKHNSDRDRKSIYDMVYHWIE